MRRRRIIGAPFAADQGLLRRDADQNQADFREQQSNRRNGQWVYAGSQQTNVQDCEDQPFGDGQNTDREEIKEEDAGQEEGKIRTPLGFVRRLERGAREFHRRVSRYRDGLAWPRPHLSPELYVTGCSGDADEEVGREMTVFRHAVVAAEEIPGHVELT